MLEQTLEKVNTVCTIVFHGGEPLIVGIDHFESLLKVVERYYPSKVKAVRIQTNGTLLSEEWISLLFIKYKHLDIEIAVSLDGTYEMNKLRVGYDNSNTYQKVIDSFFLLGKYRIKAGMLSVISKAALSYPKEYIELIASIPNIKFVKINALFNVENNTLTPDSISPVEYANFIIKTSQYYIGNKLYEIFPVEPVIKYTSKD